MYPVAFPFKVYSVALIIFTMCVAIIVIPFQSFIITPNGNSVTVKL